MLSGLKSLLFSVKQRRSLFPTKSKWRRSPLIKRRSHHCHFKQVWQRKSCNDGEEICQNVCRPLRVFAVLIISSCAELRSLVTLPRKTIDMRRFRLRGRPFNSWGVGWVISGHQEFFFSSNLVGRIFFSLFFPISFLLHLCCMQFFSSDKKS